MIEEKKEQAPWWQPGLILFYKLSAWVAGPILLSIFVGKFLDKQFGTDPWIFLCLTATAFIGSTFAIVIVYTKELKRIEEADNKNKTLGGAEVGEQHMRDDKINNQKNLK